MLTSIRHVPGLTVRLLVTVWWVFLLLIPAGAEAQASAYVLPSDRAYDDLNALIAVDLAGEIIVGQRPYSRMTFRRAVEHAREELARRGAAGEAGPKARFLEALERLERRFGPGMEPDCPPDAAQDCADAPGPAFAFRSASLDLTGADSPYRTLRGGQAGQRLDAVGNPLLQRNLGRDLADGWTLAAESQLDVQMGGHVAAQATPRVWASDAPGSGTEMDATPLTAYVRGVLGKVALDVGRVHALHGPSPESGAVLSTNPRALSRVRIGNERSGRLPWIFRHLGPVGFRLGVADMGEARDTPGSKLITIQASAQPHPNLELGLSILNHQGGDGAPEALWWERVVDTFGFILYRRPLRVLPDIPISDKLIGVDARLRIPDAGLTLYTEFATEDDHNLFIDPTQGAWYNAIWLWGGALTGLGGEGRLDLRLEGVHTGPIAYAHHRFSSGLTVDDRVLGNPIGPTAAAVRVVADWTGARDFLTVEGAWERYSGDDFVPRNPGGGRRRVADNPDEIRVRAMADWTRRMDNHLSTTARIGYERVTRFAFEDGNRANVLAQLRIEYGW